MPRSLAILLVALSALFAACSNTADASDVGRTSEDCFLGLDLWDTDPALTWIEDGRVWVRAGDHQACLAYTDAAEILWSPDGRSLLLDDGLYEAGADTASVVVPKADQIVWQQPLGGSLYAVGELGAIALVAGDRELTAPNRVQLIASHPDGDHLAAIDNEGRVTLSSGSGGPVVHLMVLNPDEAPLQMEFSADASRLWVLASGRSGSRVVYVDLLPISAKLEIPVVESIVPGMSLPVPELYFIDTDLAGTLPPLAAGVGATGSDISKFVLHPAHNDWLAVTEGRCAAAVSSLYLDGELSDAGLQGVAVGFFRGGGVPILATTSAGGECGTGALWVVDGLPGSGAMTLVAEDISSADIRDEAPDPWNPNTAPPFA